MAGIERGVGFPITAVDQFSGAFAKLRGEITTTGDKLSGLKGILASITGGIGVAGMVAFIKSTIDAHDEVNKLSQKLGIAVGELSQLRYAAELSDVSTQSLSAGVKGLSQRLIEAGDGSSKAAGLFRAMGVDVKSGTLPAIEQIADVFAQLPDGTTKSALAVEIFGKAGMELIPMLNQGQEGLQALRAEADRLGLTMSEDSAKAAETFKDNLRAVHAVGQGLAVSLFNEIAPGLVEISKRMKEAAMEGGVLHGVLEGMRAAWAEIFLGNPEKNRIAAIRKELALLEPMLDEAPGLTDRVSALNKELAGLMSFSEVGAQGAPAKPPAANSDLEAMMRKILAVKPAAEGAAKALKELGLADAHVRTKQAHDLKELLEAAREKNEEFERAMELDKARQALQNSTIQGVRELAEEMEFETSVMGLSNAERQKAIALRQLEVAGIDTTAQSVQDLANRIRDQVSAQEQLRDQASVWDQMSSAAGDFFSDLVMNGRSAFDNLRTWVKRLVADMLALFAKRWVLNIAAGGTMLGSAGNAMAGGSGGGSMAGGLLSSVGSLLPGGEIGAAFGNIANMGASFLGAGGSLASTIGSMASFLPGIGAAIGVAAMIYNAFNDGPENPNFRWMQGTGGAGAFGGISSSGNYNFDSSGLTRYIGGLDTRFARILGPEGSAAATAGLSAYTQAGLRMDGQPAQFAFPEGTDREAAEQLAKEILQSRYGTIFSQIDATIADTIKQWGGTSTELQTYIETALGVVEGLSGLGITGLDITALQQMQHEGEGLGQTFQRVSGQWAQFNELFTTEAEQLSSAQSLVTDAFRELGIEVPKTKDEFESLVRGLDLSTEAGRALFDALMDVAPAFVTVQNAASQMMSNWQSAMSNYWGSAFTGPTNSAAQQAAAEAFMANNAWTQGYTWQQVAQILPNIGAADFANYSAEDQQLITDIINLGASLGQGSQGLAGAASSATSALGSLVDGIRQAKDGIRAWLDGIFLDSTSPLTPQERLDFAQNAYIENLMKAQSGDAAALGAFTGLADAYLREAQSFWASSPEYRAIFDAVTGQAKDLAGLEDVGPVRRRDAKDNTDRIVRTLDGIRTEIRDLGNGQIALARKTEDVTKAVERMNRQQTEAVDRQTRTLRSDLGV